MNPEKQFDLCENLIAKVARCKKGTYAIITPEDKPIEFIVCGNRLQVRSLCIKCGDMLWTHNTFKGNLIIRSGRTSTPGEFYLGDSNWVHQNSSIDPYPDLVCIAIVTLPTDSNAVAGFKAVFNTECTSAYVIQDSALTDILLWESRQLEKSADMIRGGNPYEKPIN